MTVRTFGTATLKGSTWHLELAPHVALRAKRLFKRSDKGTAGRLQLSHSPEVAADLEWFSLRYPIDFRPAGVLEQAAAAHRETILQLEEFLGDGYEPRDFGMALPPRTYQARQAEVCLAQGFLLSADEVGLGKAQPLDSNVLTPSGWRRLGDLVVGDAVIDPDGGDGLVTGVFDRGVRMSYRVKTKDGASAECCDEHFWGVYSNNDRHRGGEMRVMELRAFAGDLKRQPAGRDGIRSSKWFLPVMSPASFDNAALPIDPYVLGVLIGDGSLTHGSPEIANPESEILRVVAYRLPAGVTLRHAGRISWRISGGYGSRSNPLTESLRDLGLYGCGACEKFIPHAYLTATLSDRHALLCGLMDTDGDCSLGGVAIFNTSSPRLRDGVVELVRSLGGIASVSTNAAPKYAYKGEKRTGRTAYRVNVRVPLNPFTLARKASRWVRPKLARAIESVEPVSLKQMRCISVSTRRNLYVTDGHLVTHNTVSAISVLADPRARPAVVVCPTHLPRQWKEEIRKFLPGAQVHLVNKGTPYPLETGLFGLPDVVVINYAKLSGWSAVLAKLAKTVVFDEIQALRSGSGTARYAGAAQLAETCAFRLGLSATPIYNYGGEIFNVLNILKPGVLGSFTEFVTEWCTSAGNGKYKIKDPKAFGTWAREQFVIIRHSRADVGRELPDVLKIEQTVDSDPEALAAIEGDATALARILLAQGESHRGAKMQAAEEFANALRQATGIAKAPYVAEFVRMLVESGEKVVLCGWHRAVYGIWESKLKDLGVAYFTGTETAAQKEASKQAFVKGDANVLFLSLRSGEGLNDLQFASSCIVFGELDWSPSVHEQAIGRLQRDGQTNKVVAYFLVAEDGADPTIAERLGVKKAQLEGIRDPFGAVVTQAPDTEDRVKALAEAYLKKRGVRPERPTREPEPSALDQFAAVGG